VSDVRQLAHRLRQVLLDTRADWERMPFFVRPMVKIGFLRRTGRDLDGWLRLTDDLAAGRGHGPRLVDDLAGLAESYRTAPERASRFMRDGARLEMVRARSRDREDVVRLLLGALKDA